MQGDGFDANAPILVPLLLQAAPATLSPTQSAVLEQLKTWDSQDTADSTSAAYFNAFWKHLLQDTFNDDLPEEYWPDGGSRWNEVMRNLAADSSWWDDKSTPNVVETRSEIITRAASEAFEELEKELMARTPPTGNGVRCTLPPSATRPWASQASG